MRTKRAAFLLAVVTAAVAPSGLSGQPPRSAPSPAVRSDASRGQMIFFDQGGCLSCHRVRDKGSRLGPDLTDVGLQRTPQLLEKALLDPSPQVQPQNRTYRVVGVDGATYTGKLLNQDAFSLQLLDSNEKLLGFQKSNVREFGFIPTPPMPSYRSKLSPAEVADVVAYLATLKGVSQ